MGARNTPGGWWEAQAREMSHIPLVARGESDPTGRSAHEKGAKLDAGKNRLGLVLLDFAPALLEVGRVGTFGANKYSPHGWTTVPDGEARYTDALFRHLMAEGMGEEVDPDSQMFHAAQVAWNALARLTFMMKRKQSGSHLVGSPVCDPTDALAINSEESCPKQ